MNLAIEKFRSRRGASAIAALILFLLCALVAGVILTAAGVNAGRLKAQQQTESAQMAVSSAAELLRQKIGGHSFHAAVYTASGGECGNDTAPNDELTEPEGEFGPLLSSLCQSETYPATCSFIFSGETQDVSASLSMAEDGSLTIKLSTADGGLCPTTLRFAAKDVSSAKSQVVTHSYDRTTTEDGRPISALCEYALTCSIRTVTWDDGTIVKGDAT
ncbi:MAG: hypothetical protein PHD67_06650 [Oscillospiraceae bacterium]|nr:hypothetical protein [Oscillospiraceae bacterium]